MRQAIRVLLLPALLLIGTTAAWNIVAADDPNKNDVSFVILGNPPGCVLSDADLLVSNASSEYYYKVEITATVENESSGNKVCDTDPPDCDGEICECSLSGTYEVEPDDDREFKTSCLLPNCLPCSMNCDNTTCSPTADHCVCAYGGWWVTHYSEDGQNWSSMSPRELNNIGESQLELHENCPNSESSCY